MFVIIKVYNNGSFKDVGTVEFDGEKINMKLRFGFNRVKEGMSMIRDGDKVFKAEAVKTKEDAETYFKMLQKHYVSGVIVSGIAK